MFQSEKWLEPKVLPWQHQNVHNYVSFIKFNTHVSYSKVSVTLHKYLWRCSFCDLICLHVVSLHSTIRHLKCPNSHNYTKSGISLEWKTCNQKVNAIIPHFGRIFINKLDLFLIHTYLKALDADCSWPVLHPVNCTSIFNSYTLNISGLMSVDFVIIGFFLLQGLFSSLPYSFPCLSTLQTL